MIVRSLDWRSPIAAFTPLAGMNGAHLFHAGEYNDGGWSVIAAFPADSLEFQGDDPERWLAELRKLIAGRAVFHDAPMPFASGLAGYIGYEALAGLEPSLALPPSPYALPAAHFGVYDAVAGFHKATQKAVICARNGEAADRLESALGVEDAREDALPIFENLSSNFTSPAYEQAVVDVIARIRDGDIFQANIAQTLQAQTSVAFSSLSVFARIAEASDAFFSALLQFDQGDIISNSPERFFELSQDGSILTEPIKGTRPRGITNEEDRALADALLEDPKDRAENIMIADLMRNDLSRICADHSVKEAAICDLLTLSRVHHLVSRITGHLSADTDVTDAIAALIPGGSVTGAPKVEAMRIIGEIEKSGRGPYCGVIGYIDDRGGADFSIAIRTMISDRARRKIYIPVGGGVTLRSDPVAEREETIVKARAALSAIGLSTEDAT